MNRSLPILSFLGLMLIWAAPAVRAEEPASLYPTQLIAGTAGGGGDVGQYSRLANDPDGGQYVVYYDASYGNLNYAHRGNPARPWTIEAVDTKDDIGRYCALALGPIRETSGTATVVSGSRTVEITTGTTPASAVIGGQFRLEPGGAWHEISGANPDSRRIELLAGYSGPSTSNASFTIRYYQATISYQGRANNGGSLRVARPGTAGTWAIADVDPATTSTTPARTGFETGVAIDGTGRIHVVYQDRATSDATTGQLKYAMFDGLTWKYESLLSGQTVKGSARILIDATEQVWVFVRSVNLNALEALYRPAGGSWSTFPIDNGDRAGSAMDAMFWPAGDAMYVSYQYRPMEMTDPCVRIATGLGQSSGTLTWIANAATAVRQGIGDYTSVAHAAAADTQQVVYYDSLTKNLMLVRPATPPDSTGFAPMITLDMRGDVGRFCSAAVSPADNALYATYYDASTLGLKLARNEWGSSATLTSFIDGVKAGTFSDVGTTSDSVVIAYYNASEQNLHVFQWPRSGSPADGTDTVVDATSGNVGQYVSMAVDNYGHIWLIYYDAETRNPRIAVWDGALWQTTMIGHSSINIGDYCKIAYDSGTGQLAAAWHDSDGQCINYAIWDAPDTIPSPFTFDATVNAVGAGEQVGRFLSMTWGGSKLHMAYFNDRTMSPMYSVMDSSRSLTETIEHSDFNISGWYTSIALTADGSPVVAYQDVTHGDLRFAQRTGDNTWSIKTIADTGATGFYPALGYDSATDTVYVIYYSQTDGKLMIRSKTSCACWTNERALATGTRGVRPAMRLDPENRLQISMYHQSAGDLLYMLTDANPIFTATSDWMRYR